MSDNIKVNGRKGLEDTTILQIDGGVITGLLVFLTLTSLVPLAPGPAGNIYAILITAGVIFPFALSAIMVLSKGIVEAYRGPNKIIGKVRKYSDFAQNATFWGFVYLMGAILLLLVLNVFQLFVSTPSPITEVCKVNPKDFGMETDSCAKIMSGSIYEQCVMNAMPNVSQCSKFMLH